MISAETMYTFVVIITYNIFGGIYLDLSIT